MSHKKAMKHNKGVFDALSFLFSELKKAEAVIGLFRLKGGTPVLVLRAERTKNFDFCEAMSSFTLEASGFGFAAVVSSVSGGRDSLFITFGSFAGNFDDGVDKQFPMIDEVRGLISSLPVLDEKQASAFLAFYESEWKELSDFLSANSSEILASIFSAEQDDSNTEEKTIH